MAFRRSRPTNRQRTNDLLKNVGKFVPVVSSLESRETPTVSAAFVPVSGLLNITIDNSSITTGTTHEFLRLDSSADGKQVALYNEAGTKLVTFGTVTFPIVDVTVNISGTNPGNPGEGVELILQSAGTGFVDLSQRIIINGGTKMTQSSAPIRMSTSSPSMVVAVTITSRPRCFCSGRCGQWQ